MARKILGRVIEVVFRRNNTEMSDTARTLLTMASRARRDGSYVISDLKLFDKVLNNLIGCEITKYRFNECDKEINNMVKEGKAFYFAINGEQYIAMPPLYLEEADSFINCAD